MILIGLQNPGEKYKKTRHNAGAIVLEYLKKENPDLEIYLPDTFMNLSGEYVKKVLKNRSFSTKAPLLGRGVGERVFVFFDDVTLPVGKYKISIGEGASSHNGIKSIVENIKSLGLTKDDFVRVRIGVGKVIKEVDGDGKETGKEKLCEPGPDKLSDFVLSNLNNMEIIQIQSLGKEILEKIKLYN